MKAYKVFVSIYFIFLSLNCLAQSTEIDSLKTVIARSANDTSKVNSLLQLSKAYASSSPESAMTSGIEALQLAQKLQYKTGEAYALKNIGMVYYNQTRYVETIDYWNQSYLLFDSIRDRGNESLMLNNLGSVYMNQGDYAKALDYFFKSLQISEQSKDRPNIARAMGNIGTAYSYNEFTYEKALGYYLKALAISEELNDKNTTGALLVNIGETYLKRNKDDSALYYFKKSLEAYENTENIPYSLNDIGKTYAKEGNYTLATQYHEEALSFAKKLNLQLDIVQSYLGLGDTYYKMGKYPAAINAYQKAQDFAYDISLKKELRDAYFGLATTYAAMKDYYRAYNFQTLYTNIKDSLINLDIAQKVTNLQTNFDIQKKQGQIDILTRDQALQNMELKRQKFARNTLAASLLFVFAIAFVLYSLYRKVGRRTLQLRRSLEELKSTQAQLIQSEKMASLGALTAGIGHEIQNPLNFVNNFSEVNVELLQELENGPLQKLQGADKEEVMQTIQDLIQNMMKINHHGKRADAVIKGMLQHSRKNTGQKELTDLNALADEYLRLSYHGLDPKDKTSNIDIQTDFDASLSLASGYVDINPQDLGRVLLNLYNNALYSLIEKKQHKDEAYEPRLEVHSKKLNNKIEIRIKDNGMGVPARVLDKIFQPFFTTKPTGQGTGLGLSLSYDIIKAHGGDLKVKTKEGEFAEFIIEIPMA
ncbi:MAG: tetratricopeptide repeat protein [Ginsengibacter sp.]